MQDTNLIIGTAIATINTELKGIKTLEQIIDDNFCQAVDLILNTQGKVIISGVGKSGHIAHKISATLASTGTPSFFIHPTEASHGDLGMISKNDLVIVLSNSGQTKEIKDLIYFCKKFSIPLIAITRRAKSELASIATVSLIVPEIEEANSVNAPTTSTTMMLVLGDAIAVSLIKLRKFNQEHFSILHPGGKLGSALLKVKAIMRTGTYLPIVKTDDKMATVIVEMTTKSLGCTAVVNSQNQLVGIITDGDLRRNLNNNFLENTANSIMSLAPQTIGQDFMVNDAIEIMNKKAITSLFVVEQQKIIGIVHIHDCLREINA